MILILLELTANKEQNGKTSDFGCIIFKVISINLKEFSGQTLIDRAKFFFIQALMLAIYATGFTFAGNLSFVYKITTQDCRYFQQDNIKRKDSMRHSIL